MITYLQGKLVEAHPSSVVVDIQGLGYEALIPISCYERLPAIGTEIRLLTHLVIREDAHSLYGFLTDAERDLFRLLIQTVSGIGPRMALGVLGAMPPDQFQQAVHQQDIKRLSSISGIGRKTAERIVVELKDKLDRLQRARPANSPAWAPNVSGSTDAPAHSASDLAVAGAVAGLIKLDMKPADADTAVRSARALLGDTATTDQLILAVLKRLGGGS